MPAIQRSEFALALNQVATERGVDVSVVLETVKNAILAAYRKDHPGTEIEEYIAELNPNTGEAKILKDGDDVTPPGFGRIAAQTAKQVILQKIREKEKEAILSDYKLRIGTVVNGMVLRFAGPNVIVDIGKTESVMPPTEQVQQEKYHLNQRLSVHLLEIRPGVRGDEIIVSRSSNGLLEGLFKREVPEVAQGSVQIKAVVREPGNRSKVAVYSNQPGIDPVGSCVGQKGVRIQAVIAEFSGLEKIDIIQWTDDPKGYIANALSPAKNVRVEINEEEKVAHVYVPQDDLSLAIGQGGQNVRLASKLTGYRLEIESDEPVVSAESADESKEEEIKESEATEKPQAKKTKAKAKAKTKKEEKTEEADEKEAVTEPVTSAADSSDKPKEETEEAKAEEVVEVSEVVEPETDQPEVTAESSIEKAETKEEASAEKSQEEEMKSDDNEKTEDSK